LPIFFILHGGGLLVNHWSSRLLKDQVVRPRLSSGS
jgi:hypothetical protein